MNTKDRCVLQDEFAGRAADEGQAQPEAETIKAVPAICCGRAGGDTGKRRHTRRYRRLLEDLRKMHIATATAIALALAGCADNPVEPAESEIAASYSVEGRRAVTVMSRNLYLGANLDAILAIQNPNEVPGAVAQAWAQVVANNFPERAEALAAEIQKSGAQLIGLQEATIYRRQSPSDYVLGNRTANATAVVYDFVEILISELAERGLTYRAVSRVVNNDLEFPMFTGQGPLPFDDIRYTDQDVILALDGVAISNPFAQNFAAAVPLAIGGVPVQLKRGWVAVDAAVGGKTIRFTNTHLEVQTFRPIQEAQARQLVAWMGTSPHPVVLVGDLNSAANPDAPPASLTASYDIVRAAGFDDVWLRGREHGTGLTCCHQPDLSNPIATLTQRIDFIMVTEGAGRGSRIKVVGDQPSDRTPSGLWPSDHAGVVATLRFRR